MPLDILGHTCYTNVFNKFIERSVGERRRIAHSERISLHVRERGWGERETHYLSPSCGCDRGTCRNHMNGP